MVVPLNTENQDMLKITSWFGLETTPELTDTRILCGKKNTKSVVICHKIKVDLSASLTCKGLAHCQSLKLL